MSILKACLYTILLIAIETFLTIGFPFIIEHSKVNPDYLIHYYSPTRIIIKLMAYFIMLFLIIKLKFNFSDSYEKIKKVDWKTMLLILLTALGYVFFSKPLWDIKLIIYSLNDIDTEPINYATDSLKQASGYTFISGVILAPILEELFFRKILFKRLLNQNSFVISVIVSSLCFASIHILPNWQDVLPTFIFGVICCLIYINTKNILYPILFHFTGNLITIILLFYNQQIFTYQPEFNWNYWLAFIIGTGLTIFGVRKIKTTNNI